MQRITDFKVSTDQCGLDWHRNRDVLDVLDCYRNRNTIDTEKETHFRHRNRDVLDCYRNRDAID